MALTIMENCRQLLKGASASAVLDGSLTTNSHKSLTASPHHRVKLCHTCSHCSNQFSLVEFKALISQVVIQWHRVGGLLDRCSELFIFLYFGYKLLGALQ
jgi:hypothetical protein